MFNSNNLLAYSEDKVSRRLYTIKIKNIETNSLFEDEIENTFGIEYNSCCWQVRLVYQEGLDSNVVAGIDDERQDAIYFQFVLRGLGGTGSQVETLLDETIYGYRNRDPYE